MKINWKRHALILGCAHLIFGCSTISSDVDTRQEWAYTIRDFLDHTEQQRISVVRSRGIDYNSISVYVSSDLKKKYAEASRVIARKIIEYSTDPFPWGRDPETYFSDAHAVLLFRSWPHVYDLELLNVIEVLEDGNEGLVVIVKIGEKRWKESAEAEMKIWLKAESGEFKIDDLKWIGDRQSFRSKLSKIEKSKHLEATDFFKVIDSLRFHPK